jgi:hypothetical protein
MQDEIRRIIDRQLADNLQRLRESDFETCLRNRLAEKKPAPAARTQRLIPALAWGAGAALVLAAIAVLSIVRTQRPMISLAEIESAFGRVPGFQTNEEAVRIPGGSNRESLLSRVLERALRSVLYPNGESLGIRNSIIVPPGDSRQTIETAIREHLFERVLTKYSNLNKEV